MADRQSGPIAHDRTKSASMSVAVVNAIRGQGGAALAAQRLHASLGQAGLDARFVCLDGYQAGDLHPQPSANPLEAARRLALRAVRSAQARAGTALRPKLAETFELQPIIPQKAARLSIPSCDIVNLHWVSIFLTPETIAWIADTRAPIVWTLHDMVPFTGGCHYDNGCGRFEEACGQCPQLFRPGPNDLSRRNFERKRRAYSSIPADRLTIVAPSRWMAEQCTKSALLGERRIEVIPNSVDLQTFSPRPKDEARHSLGLPVDRPIVLLVSANLSNGRKGGQFVAQIMERIRAGLPGALLVTVGGGKLPSAVEHRSLGTIRDDREMAAAYAAADITILPSLQDNLPNTMLESMACGTPVVGFNTGGVPDFVLPGQTGALASAGDAGAFGEVALRILKSDRTGMAQNARRLIERECAFDVQAQRYKALFGELAGRNRL
ncbi:glycosyltransferase [Mesorhizobium sp. CGMCC 1.15528]|uniref:Glycosyltransferase n=1 Tax=Mesorhizobium zhangyense TaxID=1776730 RepID=A0A7C9VG47_9HYPH|nr:glycosyltransferase [Mesorhizobium zhangyense]NGN44172.1 glycosyltransferase [Mesorhizobium zhangyense]